MTSKPARTVSIVALSSKSLPEKMSRCRSTDGWPGYWVAITALSSQINCVRGAPMENAGVPGRSVGFLTKRHTLSEVGPGLPAASPAESIIFDCVRISR